MSVVLQTVAPSPDDDGDPEAAGVGTILVYEVTTEPDPVRASPAEGTVERANLVIVGSRHSDSGIEARKLTVYIPTGTASAELALDLTGIAAHTSLPGWTATSDSANQRIVFAPPSGTKTIEPGQGVTIQLDGIRINSVVGSAPVVLELEYRNVGTSAWKTDTTTLGVGKFPTGFHLRNLRVSPLIVENGCTATLEWEASEGATYKLLYGTAEIDVTDRRDYPAANIRQSTMFYLRAIAQSGNNNVERTLSTSVTVNEPDLVVRTLTVRESTVIEGEVTITGALTANGAVDLFRAGQTLQTPMPSRYCKFTAPTAGFLTAKITSTSASSSTANVRAVLGDQIVVAEAHAAAADGNGSETASLPVPQGAECTYWLTIRSGGGVSPHFRWTPLGAGGRVSPSEHFGTP